MSGTPIGCGIYGEALKFAASTFLEGALIQGDFTRDGIKTFQDQNLLSQLECVYGYSV
jgi:hypothetical protein